MNLHHVVSVSVNVTSKELVLSVLPENSPTSEPRKHTQKAHFTENYLRLKGARSLRGSRFTPQFICICNFHTNQKTPFLP